ncbi:uncharacterized protein LOC129610322 [Condylostylus longicornis]|uniref:uncharacterized protein LOC129610322 n=1 Tax=Condylostylus longicornis TaxID=2530218 RepID=UPI00244DBB12|nr:uncharacterized protein LOC129610322 [Condylostylus longicornis]
MSYTYSPYECPISKQIAEAEDTIVGLKNRVRGLEDLLESRDLDDEQRDSLEKELIEIRNILDHNREALKGLHKQNTKSFIVAGCVIFVCFLIYGIYCIIYNPY